MSTTIQIDLEDSEVKRWVAKKEILASSTNKYGELFVITHAAEVYRLFRFFRIGDQLGT